jgi:hypothetical protein
MAWGDWLSRLTGRTPERELGPIAPPKPPPPVPKAEADPLGLPDFLARLRIGDRSGLSDADFRASAARLGIAPSVLEAVVRVECAGLAGFGENGLPTIRYEPHTFSAITGHRFDAQHPDASYAVADERKEPASQDVRWLQLGRAFTLDAEAALKATNWGAFQISGLHFATCGFQSAGAFVAYLAGSEARQLEAFEGFIRTHKLAPVLKARKWREFARVYNGPALAKRYGRKLEWVHRGILKGE